MTPIKVLSKKYDGTLRDEYTTSLYSESDDAVILFSLPGLSYFDHRKKAWFEADDGLIEIYFRQRWYNVWHICEQHSGINHTYINITMPTQKGLSSIEWIDLDIDYRVHLDHTVARLDQDEFDRNRERMSYPPSLIQNVELACQEVEAGLAGQLWPFDHDPQVELYNEIRSTLSAD